MQSLENNQNYNIKFKDLKPKQKISLLIFFVFVISLLVFLCYSAENFNIKTRKIIGSIFLVIFILFILVDFFILCFPTKKDKATLIIKTNGFLFNYDFTVLTPVFSKDFCEIIFTDNSEVDISFIFSLKKINSPYCAYFHYKDYYFNIYSIYEDLFFENDDETSEDNKVSEIEYPDFKDIVIALLDYKKTYPNQFYELLDTFILNSGDN